MKCKYGIILVCCFALITNATDTPKEKKGIKRKYMQEEVVQEVPSTQDLMFEIIYQHNVNGFTQLLRAFPNTINEQDENGETFLMAAVHANDVAILDILLQQRNIDPDLANKHGITPLMAAIIIKNDDIAEHLIHGMASLGIIDNEGNTALMYAVNADNNNIVKLLLDLGNDTVDINHINNQGMFALMLAALKGNRDIVSLLLNQSDINVNLANEAGQTALSIARDSTHANKDAIIKLLIARGARE